jgi:hypothetical protein
VLKDIFILFWGTGNSNTSNRERESEGERKRVIESFPYCM